MTDERIKKTATYKAMVNTRGDDPEQAICAIHDLVDYIEEIMAEYAGEQFGPATCLMALEDAMKDYCGLEPDYLDDFVWGMG